MKAGSISNVMTLMLNDFRSSRSDVRGHESEHQNDIHLQNHPTSFRNTPEEDDLPSPLPIQGEQKYEMKYFSNKNCIVNCKEISSILSV